jgi:predicted nucleic acid-binding protein
MAASALVDTGFLVALLSRRDDQHGWAAELVRSYPPPWRTCEAVLSETAHLLGPHGVRTLAQLVRRDAVVCGFHFADHREAVLKLLEKYADVPMSFADACLVRMTETLDDPMLLTTDMDFRVYRRHGRQSIPCAMPR